MMKYLFPIFAVVVAGLSLAALDPKAPEGTSVNVTQHHNNPSRDGLYIDPAFTITAAGNLTRDLGFDGTIVGQVYAQPLYVEGGPSGPMVIAVTELNNVYALNATTGAIIWQRNLGTPSGGMGNISPNVGITGTPVVDLASRSLFVNAVISGPNNMIFSLNVDTGATNAGWPVNVNARISGFSSANQSQRAALGLLGSIVYVPYGGYWGDAPPYFGRVLGVQINDPAATIGSFATTSTRSGIWGPGGIASDGTNIFVTTGNGPGGVTWNGSEAVIRLQPGPSFSNSTVDYFAPTNWASLDSGDSDLGGSGPVLVDVPGATPSALVVQYGKDGKVYLLNRNTLGGVSAPITSFSIGGSGIQAAAAYRTATGTYAVFRPTTGTLTALRITATNPPALQSAWSVSSSGRGSPFVTSTDGTNNVIVWAVGSSGGDQRLHGHNGDTGAVVFNGGSANEVMTGTRGYNTAAIAARGRIYVANDNRVYAFSLTQATPSPTPTATATATASPTPTATATATPTATATVTPTATATATATVPPSPTPTATPSATPGCVAFSVTINGAQEVPPNGSAATGTGIIQVDTVTNQLSYNITFSGLGSAETMAHIHGFAPPGMNAGIIHTLPLGSPKIGVFNYAQADEANILNGLSYVNIHSVNFPNGEIRGQIAGQLPCSDPPSPTPTATATATVPPSATPSPSTAPVADVVLNIADSPDPVQVGQNLTYTITVSVGSIGLGHPLQVTVNDALPASVTFFSVTPSQGACFGTSAINCQLGTLPPNSSATVVFVGTPTQAGPISNTATAVSNAQDPNQFNNSATASTTVVLATTPTPTPTLSPGITPSPTPTATATIAPSATPAQAVNLSTRMFVQTGDNAGIGGFIISGGAPKHVLIRVIGPSLTQFGVPNALADPILELHPPGGSSTVNNDNWQDDPVQQAAILATGLAPANNLESAIDVTLNPGAYTAVARGKNNSTGVGLIEVFDLSQAVPAKLANISTRAFVNAGDNVVIAGFILGSNNGNDRIVLRGIGPSLTVFGVANALPDPALELRDGNGALLLANNDWQDDPAQAAELIAAGLAPTNLLESGIASTLPPGLYTALLSGFNNATGVGVVEVYDRGAP